MNPARSHDSSEPAAARAARDPGPASGSRRRATDAPTRAAQVRTAQLRVVGTAFLRVRPLVVAPIAVVNSSLLAASGAPLAQRIALGAGFACAIALFAAERWSLRRRVVSARWLAGSLAATVMMLALACVMSGGLASPVLPLLAAPIVVAAAAFGRSPVTRASSGLALALAIALALAPAPFPPIAAPWAAAMTVGSFVGLLALAYAGVASLVDAHVRSGEILDRMRQGVIEEAASRMRATEQVGARVAHELKNPLAGIKALLQLVQGGELPAKAAERLAVAVGEVDRMDGIVRDYLAFARPLADLELAPVELRALADEVASVLEARAQLAGVALVLAGGRRVVTADARRLREALYNLVDNAIAASPPRGTVVVRVDAAGWTVEDDGPGIDLGAPGAPFVTTKPGGTGLGLTLARAAIAQHGGELVFARRVAGGTCARVRLPDAPGGALV